MSNFLNEKIEETEALTICRDGFLANTAINQIITQGIFNATFAIEICANDVITTGNATILQLHLQMFIDAIIEIILLNPGEFVNKPWLSEVLLDLCPNRCSGEGFCNLSKFI